jgi:hypothetical protein
VPSGGKEVDGGGTSDTPGAGVAARAGVHGFLRARSSVAGVFAIVSMAVWWPTELQAAKEITPETPNHLASTIEVR